MEKPKEHIQEVLGAAAPVCGHYKEGKTNKRLDMIMEASKELQEVLTQAKDIQLSADKYKDFTFADMSCVIFDACAALIAERGCSVTNVENTTMTIPDALRTSCELIQHHFSDKQKELFDYMGNWVH